MESLSISDELPILTTLPADILYIVLTYLDTAKSVANLAASCKGLHHLITESGWRIFVTSRFSTFKLSQVSSTEEWSERAFSLTSQSRDWDRRAFAVSALKPVVKHRGRAFSHFSPSQSIPSNIIVDAHHQRQGNDAHDLVFWGAGEDIFGLLRHTRGSKASNDEWLSSRGATAGYRSGKDDVTCVSILKDSKYNYGQEDESQVLVGRASGHLHLLSMGASNFGNAVLNFRPSRGPASGPDNEAIRQTEIQSLDVNYKQGTLAAATKLGILTYSLNHDGQAVHSTNSEDSLETGATPHVWADDSLALKDNAQSGAFEYIRSIKFVNGDTLAVGLNKGYNPLQYLKYTPTGVDVSYAAKASNSHDSVRDYKLRTVRALLPIGTNSLAHGGGNGVLSSWDDGTIRLQDLRTPSAADQIFQDNFDLSTPINALLSRGLERFVAGSAYSPVLKVFDYRWPKGYYHTEALPCGNDEPYPAPRPPTIVPEPSYSDDRVACDYMAGKRCRWHELSRHDFYRPNFNMWLPASASDTSPIYTLASPSDDSPTLFAGLSGMLVEITPKSSTRPTTRPNFGPAKDLAYVRQVDSVAFIETGSGYAVDDVSQSQRVPPMYRQFFRDLTERDRGHPERAIWRKRHRLDEWLQRCA
ncbi:uncharacterized protein F4812DRAFT_37337 [Daldinia caldariorum]|uniref:uncharacterized protein n=1 Tax=Daldinia caldariorum TaxID=326644 RepID=UPI0020083CF4|nr:uncharacterized protein F4812DRAFT_37337 [Daldinia caldariorum]KAI1473055.1 hypothetical protein F4812DRAFT_37337 [Daldinia caldariorum]